MIRKGEKIQERLEDYDGFVEKFKAKHTTDDCYTPPNIYDVVADYVAERFNLDRSKFVRPFYPGGDFEAYDYPDGCTVVDNPPFSIAKKIVHFYEERGIPFFLFCGTLTACGLLHNTKTVTIYPVGVGIVYANGADINTSFVGNLEPGYVMRTLPDLRERLDEANKKNLEDLRVHVPAYSYPDYVISAALAAKFSRYGVAFDVPRESCAVIRSLDHQKEHKKAIFGSGLLLSEKAAAEKAAAEKAAAEKAAAEKAAAEKTGTIVWQLSDREREIVARLA